MEKVRMSEPLNAVELENQNLKQQLQNNAQGVENLLAQLDAHKGAIADANAINLNIRTQLILWQKQNKLLNDRNLELMKQIEGVNKQLEDATKRISELEPK